MTVAGPSRSTRLSTRLITILSDHSDNDNLSEWAQISDAEIVDHEDMMFEAEMAADLGAELGTPLPRSLSCTMHDSPEHHHSPSVPRFVNQPATNHVTRSRGAARAKESKFARTIRKFGSRIPFGFFYDGPRRQRGGKPANFWPHGVMVRKDIIRS